jgi:hypothetical protein
MNEGTRLGKSTICLIGISAVRPTNGLFFLGPVYGNGKENWRIFTNKDIYTVVKNLLS